MLSRREISREFSERYLEGADELMGWICRKTLTGSADFTTFLESFCGGNLYSAFPANHHPSALCLYVLETRQNLQALTFVLVVPRPPDTTSRLN